jgi:hypothetical protein
MNFELWLENGGKRLGDLIEAKYNFPDADFWLVRKGSLEAVGKPTKIFKKENIGVKVTSDTLLPSYLFLVLEYLHMQKYWQTRAGGTTRLMNIKIADVNDIWC